MQEKEEKAPQVLKFEDIKISEQKKKKEAEQNQKKQKMQAGLMDDFPTLIQEAPQKQMHNPEVIQNVVKSKKKGKGKQKGVVITDPSQLNVKSNPDQVFALL